MPQHIVIVDDNELDLYYARLVIERHRPDLQVSCFDNPAAALQAVQSADPPPDLVLLDINMPGMSGFEFLDAYRPARAPVAMLTSSPDPVDRERALAHQAVRDYLVKPLDPAALDRLLERGRP